MRLNEFSSPLNKYLVTVNVHGTSVKTLIHAETQSQARLLLGKMFGKDNVQSITSISTNESQTTILLNLQESVSADDLVMGLYFCKYLICMIHFSVQCLKQS
jgi:hypothetical protein